MDTLKLFFASKFNKVFIFLALLFTGISYWILKDRKKSKSWMRFLPWVFGIIGVVALFLKNRIVASYSNT